MKNQRSKDEQVYVEKIQIYSGIAAAGKELQEKQLNTSKTKSKKTHQEKKKKVRKRKKKKLKINVFLSFFDQKHKEENSTELQKANMEVEICRVG